MAEPTLFDEASLALIASGGAGKDGKVYSIKPTTGDGDFTFSRGSNLAATRVGADGLIEKGRENLLVQSNTFNSGSWVGFTTTRTGGQAGYDGSSDAWLLTSTTNYTGITQNVSSSGIHTFSAYLKDDNIYLVQLKVNGSSFNLIDIDLTNGVITGQAGSEIVDKGIEPVGNGWYRAYIVVNDSVSSVQIVFNDIAGTSFYIQDAQLEVGLAATDYIESGATTGKAGLLEDEPRFDYSGGATCPSLLLEPSRTNLTGYSEYVGGMNFNNVSATANATTSPEGVGNAYEVTTNTTTENHFVSNLNIINPSNTYTISGYFKKSTKRYCSIGINQRTSSGSYMGSYTQIFDLDTTTWGSGFSEATAPTYVNKDFVDMGNGWYRLILTCTLGATAGILKSQYGIATSSTNTYYGGSNTDAIYLWGLQVEEASYPTSYIPNHSGGSVTRGAETSLASNISSLFGSNNTFYSEFVYYTSSTSTFLEVNQDGGAANLLQINATSSDKINYTIFANGAFIASRSTNSILTDGVMKVALKYDGVNYKVFLNGSLVDTYSQTSIPVSLNRIYCGNARGAQQFGKGISQTLLFPEALSDTELIKLTTI